MRATGSVPKFEGFQAIYREGKDQKDEEDEEETEDSPAEERPSRGGSAPERIKELERLLQEALAREDYEMAARIRDELRRLQGRSQESDS
jgi:protein-arginine kinase activator protein McsA